MPSGWQNNLPWTMRPQLPFFTTSSKKWTCAVSTPSTWPWGGELSLPRKCYNSVTYAAQMILLFSVTKGSPSGSCNKRTSRMTPGATSRAPSLRRGYEAIPAAISCQQPLGLSLPPTLRLSKTPPNHLRPSLPLWPTVMGYQPSSPLDTAMPLPCGSTKVSGGCWTRLSTIVYLCQPYLTRR